jgi:5S rRNA maturation endonuclease (ribonuclease M5)
MHPILEKIYNLLPPDKKQRNNKWIAFNGPCCEEYGHENPDKKARGNMLFTDDSCVYNCFNCHYTTGFKVGQYMSKKFIDLLFWMGTTSKELNDLRLMIREYNESNTSGIIQKNVIKKREIRKIPKTYKLINNSLLANESNIFFKNAYQYISQRNPRLLGYADLYWANKQNNFLIPCIEYNEVVGYSLRSLDDNSKSKYIHFIPYGYIYNYDNLLKNRKYEILVEGQLDALSINGIAYLGSTLTDDRLKRLLPFVNDKELIICPDRDNAGKKIVKQVLEQNLPFSVAFPNWDRGIKDSEEAVKKYGRLYTIYTILNSKEKDKTLIKMNATKWFN